MKYNIINPSIPNEPSKICLSFSSDGGLGVIVVISGFLFANIWGYLLLTLFNG